MKKTVTFIFTVLITGCSTVGEILLEGAASMDYSQTTDSNGNTKFERRRIVDSSRGLTSLPPPTPLLSIEPTSYEYSSSTDSTQQTKTTTDNEYPLSGGLVISSSANENTFNGDISYEWLGQYISGDVGISMVGSDLTYFGFSGQLRAHFPWKLSPYVGAGLYGGDSKTCYYQPIGGGYSEEICEKYYLFSTTADLGLQYLFTDNLQVRIFGRSFSKTRQGDPLRSELYGLAFAFYF